MASSGLEPSPGGRAARLSSLRANVIANYAGQLYAAGTNIVFVPVQVRLLGAEAYGLVGFFAVLSGWLQLLDVGLSPTLARETAKYRAGALDAPAYTQLLRALEWLFLCVGVLIAGAVFAASGPIATGWLRPQMLSPGAVGNAVALMGLAFAFRWQATLSRSVLVGLERLVWLNFVTAAFASLRSIGVLAVLRWVDASPKAFFLYQTAVAALELIVLRISVRVLVDFGGTSLRWSMAPIRRIAPFSLTIALTSSAWVLVTQMDKLILSKLLPLSEYAWFSLAVTAATGISLVAGPIGQAVQPRLTYLFADDEHGSFRSTYSDATQTLSATALTASLFLAFGARPILWMWTGNAQLAEKTAPVLSFYALGNGLLAVTAMTYYLQIAGGDLRLHVRGILAFVAALLPMIVVATRSRGMVGASTAWLVANLLFFAVWTPVVHHRFLPGIHLRWVMRDVLLPALPGLIPTLVLTRFSWNALDRFHVTLVFALTGLFSVGLASLVTRPAQRVLSRLGRQLFGNMISQ